MYEDPRGKGMRGMCLAII